MIRSILIAVFFLLLSLPDSAAQSQPIVSQNGQWTVDWYDGITISTRHFKFSEDSILFDGHYYRQLKSQFYGALPWQDMGIFYRTEGNKTYRYRNGVEKLIYDFGLVVGDTIKGDPILGQSDMVVSAVDSVFMLDGTHRNQIEINCQDNTFHWIEGIGGTHLFLDNDDVCSLAGNFKNKGYVRCYGEENRQVFISENYNSCIPPLKYSFIDTLSLWKNGTLGFSAPVSFRTKFSSTPIMLDGKEYYQKLSETTENGNNWEITPNRYYREEANKVYLRLNQIEHLYMDFDLIVGDTFHDNGWDMIVTDRDYAGFNDGSLRIRITLKCLENNDIEFQWIEGVGRLVEGLYCTLDGYDSEVYCYYENGKLRWMNPEKNDCWTTVTNEISSKIEITLFPNPTTGLVTINTETSFDDITIFGPDGKKIFENCWLSGAENWWLSGAETTDFRTIQIDLSSFPNGMYSVRLTKGTEWVMYRVMKVE